jgi:hypothetical protein
MPKGPKGETRHTDTVQNAMFIGRIATGETEDIPSTSPNRAKGGKGWWSCPGCEHVGRKAH